MTKRILIVICAAVLIASSLFSGCGKVVEDTVGDSTTTTAASTTSSTITTTTATTTTTLSWTSTGNGARFSARSFNSLTSFEGQLWVICGNTEEGSAQDVWCSPTGGVWTLVATNPGLGPRYYHATLVHDNKLWVIGGGGGIGNKHDVWSSVNGQTWTREANTTNFPARFGHSVIESDNKLVLIGGTNGSAFFNDVWSSTNEVNWTQIAASPFESSRAFHGCFVFDNKIWVIGGASSESGIGLQTIWSSADNGANWSQEASISVNNGGWMNAFRIRCVTANNKIYLYDNSNRLFVSTNGADWTALIGLNPANTMYGGGFEYFDNKVWVVGGCLTGNNRTNEVEYCPVN